MGFANNFWTYQRENLNSFVYHTVKPNESV